MDEYGINAITAGCPTTATYTANNLVTDMKAWLSPADYAAIMYSIFGQGGDYKDIMTLAELDIYGSKRMGMVQINRQIRRVDYAGTINTSTGYGNVQAYGYADAYIMPNLALPYVEFPRTLGVKPRGGRDRRYELTNHLGNVLVVISDKKLITNVSGTLYFDGEVITAQDYYARPYRNGTFGRAFGSSLPARSYQISGLGGYRYGFNGKENDNEVRGNGDACDYGARIYDSRLGRWMSVDPEFSKFASFSPFVFVIDNPVRLIDIKGLNPGDPFTSQIEAVKDFAKIYNVKSIRTAREIATTIYAYRDKDNNLRYSYTTPKSGNVFGSVAGKLETSADKKKVTTVADAHTHGNYLKEDDDDFSKDANGDYGEYESKSILHAFVVVPNGNIREYISDKTGETDKIIDSNAPSDPADPNHNDNVVALRPIDKIVRGLSQFKYTILNSFTKNGVTNPGNGIDTKKNDTEQK